MEKNNSFEGGNVLGFVTMSGWPHKQTVGNVSTLPVYLCLMRYHHQVRPGEKLLNVFPVLVQFYIFIVIYLTDL